MRFPTAVALAIGLAAPARAEVFLVGPTRPLEQLTDVAPLVGPGDLVLVDGGAVYGPVLFENDGDPGNPIVVRGVRVGGVRPVIEGGDHHTIEIQSDHFVLEGFEVRGGSFRCVYHHGDDLTLRDLYVHDCASHGITSADEDSGSLTIEYTEVTRAGEGSGEHALYVTSDQNAHPGSVFRLRHSWIHDQNGGNALKSRAERNEIHFNWFEGTRYHLMELIGPDEGAVDPPAGIREDSDVVGNVLVHKAYDPPEMPWGTNPPAIDGLFSFVRIGSDMLCEDGGSNSTRGRYRFANNTFVRQGVGGGSAVFRPFGFLQSVAMANNVVWSSPASQPVPIFRFNGIGTEACWTNGEQIAGQNNWVESGTDPASIPAGWTGTLSAASPLFADAAGYDFRLTSASPARNQGIATPLDPAGYPFPSPHWPASHEPPLRSVLPGSPAPARIATGAIDLGAYEFPGSLFTDGFEIQSPGRWSLVEP
jgi:hypothetical protein